MKLEPSVMELLGKKLEKGTPRLSLEEVMMLYYERPCRRAFAPYSDPLLGLENVLRGSVVVTDDEVVVVCKPLDFHLYPHKDSPQFAVQSSVEQELFRAGTTLVRNEGIVYVTDLEHELRESPESVVRARFGGIMLDNRLPLEQMEDFTKSSYCLAGGHCRVFTCKEEITLAAARSGEAFTRGLMVES